MHYYHLSLFCLAGELILAKMTSEFMAIMLKLERLVDQRSADVYGSFLLNSVHTNEAVFK